MHEPIDLHSVSAFQEISVCNDIKLRPLRNSDSRRLLEILESDSTIRDKVTVASRFHKPEDIDTEIKRYQKDTGLIRYVMLKKDNPIGFVSLWRDTGYFGTHPNLDDYGFGYFLDPTERGKGLVTSALESLMDTVVKNLKVNQFVAFCEDSNNESIAVLKKLDFKATDHILPEPLKGWAERKYIKLIKQRG